MSTELPTELWPGWKTVRIIGQGSFGAVYEIERTMLGISEKAALKVITIPQSDSDIQELLNDGYDEETVTCTFKDYLVSIVSEYNLMRKLNGCSNVVNCDDYRYVQHQDGLGWDIFIKMELLTPLAKALPKEITEEMALQIGIDICKALVLCAKYDIIHRDIKPQNIFVSPNGDYKLGDFGIAKTVEKTSGGTKVGTYKYMAPEVYNNQPYGASADIYSLGLVMYWLLNEKRLPFLPLTGRLNPKVDEEARTRRLQGEALPAPAHGSKELKRIVLKACAYDPKERYHTAVEMFKDLQHVNDPIIVPDPVPVFPEKQKLTDYFAQSSLAEQYVRETASTSVYAPVQEKGFWRCTCGEIQPNSNTVCSHCKLNKASVFALLDVKHLTEGYAAYTEQVRLAEENKQKEEEEQKRIEQEKQLELVRQQIHQERIQRGQELAQKKEREAAERAAKRERKGYYAIIAICIGIFLAVAWTVNWTQRIQKESTSYEVATTEEWNPPAQSSEQITILFSEKAVLDRLWFSSFAIKKNQVSSISFLAYQEECPVNSYDVDLEHTGAIKAWAEPNGELYDIYVACASVIYAPAYSHDLFSRFTNAERIDVSGLDTSNVLNMTSMFSYCSSLTTLDLSNFDTSNVQYMTSMFSYCSNLTTLDLSNFDTSYVKYMTSMFSHCSNLTTLDLSNFNTSYVRNMTSMFYNCSSLPSHMIPKWYY